ncbi:RluA family pseudouridine synthase [Arenibaculum pallidiluteum]|uniref:RluA family pseudouridine synthase n=1 Tax=Arenibaculum pallidiluteum TaxID=2812559 RepID=UPI001A97D22B|nr:RNA pseudouridine synthase [Arenibaculum pallidiluteum]
MSPNAATPDELARRVLHRDANLLVLDKPAGLAVHPGPRTPESLEAFLPALAFGLCQPPAIVHRLDRDTAGCLVLARHPKALRRVNRLFAEGAVGKTYWALVRGSPREASGTVDLALLKVSGPQGWRMVVDPAGQPATTAYRVLGAGGGIALVELQPRTGRTHQIRVHLAALGCPILDDPVYGTARPGAPHALLARRIVVPPLSPSGTGVDVIAPPPPHMRGAIETLAPSALLSPSLDGGSG